MNLLWQYTGQCAFDISAPADAIERLSFHLDEISQTALSTPMCKISMRETNIVVAVPMSKEKPYFRSECVDSSGWSRITHYLYDVPIRTITKASNGLYSIDTQLRQDELGILMCMRDHILSHNATAVILHAALVAWDGRGLLVAGPSGCGKTSSLMLVCQKHGACLIADEDVLLTYTDHWVGTYLPRVHLVPLSLVSATDLRALMHDLRSTAATQVFDQPWLQEQISTGYFPRKGGLCVARRIIAQLCACSTSPSAPIHAIVFPVYDAAAVNPLQQHLTHAETIRRLRQCVRRSLGVPTMKDLKDAPNALPTTLRVPIPSYEIKYRDIESFFEILYD